MSIFILRKSNKNYSKSSPSARKERRNLEEKYVKSPGVCVTRKKESRKKRKKER